MEPPGTGLGSRLATEKPWIPLVLLLLVTASTLAACGGRSDADAPRLGVNKC